MAALCLHNYLAQTDNSFYCLAGYVDSVNSSRKIVDGPGCLQNLPLVKGGQRKKDANEMREALKDYVNSEKGSVAWQLSHVRNTGQSSQ